MAILTVSANTTVGKQIQPGNRSGTHCMSVLWPTIIPHWEKKAKLGNMMRRSPKKTLRRQLCEVRSWGMGNAACAGAVRFLPSLRFTLCFLTWCTNSKTSSPWLLEGESLAWLHMSLLGEGKSEQRDFPTCSLHWICTLAWVQIHHPLQEFQLWSSLGGPFRSLPRASHPML